MDTENGKMRKKRNKRNSDRNGGIRTKIQDYSAKIRMVGVYVIHISKPGVFEPKRVILFRVLQLTAQTIASMPISSEQAHCRKNS